MSIYKKIAENVAKNPDLIRPHVKTSTISTLNFEKMKEMGMEKIFFCKENVLTRTGKD